MIHTKQGKFEAGAIYSSEMEDEVSLRKVLVSSFFLYSTMK